MKKHFKKYIFFILLLVIFFSPLLYLRYFPDFLLKNQKVESNILLAEGWLKNPELWIVNREFHKGGYDYIITTGQEFPDYYKMNLNGFLIFHIDGDSLKDGENEMHEIRICAESSLAEGIPAHFNFLVNEKIVGDFHVYNNQPDYRIQWEGRLSDIDSVIIHFDNDAYRHGEDRNLFVKRISIDSFYFNAYDKNVVYDIHRLDGRQKKTSFARSYAESARETLIGMGMDPGKIISVAGNDADFLRTFYSALSFKEWVEDSGIRMKGITIITRGIHSRRTWMTYKAVLDMPGRVGIIALPDPIKPGLHKARRYLLYETAGYFYYRFIQLPWYEFKTWLAGMAEGAGSRE